MSKLYETATEKSQNLQEHDEFLELLRQEGVLSYLEIGSRFGCTLWRVTRALPRGSVVAAIDLPHDEAGRSSLVECVDELRSLGYDARYYLGDSTAPGAVEFAKSAGPFDCLFIDANHELSYVTRDWENYGPLARIVAFHDVNHTISVKPGRNPIEVYILWNKLKTQFRYREIIHDDKCNGIGVLWTE